MIIKALVDEDFANYKLPSMFVITAFCSFKCEKESGARCCQNSDLANAESHEVSNGWLVKRYAQNPITKAIVFGGLEPMDQFDDVLDIVKRLGASGFKKTPIVIYTGYTEDEIGDERIKQLSESKDNIIVKFGRFIPGQHPHYDKILGVDLASDNQYAKRIS